MPYSLFCIGNPLLDMQVTNGEELLKKYNLKENDAILAGPEHAELYDNIVKNHKITYVAGGAAQNAARAAAYVLPPGSVVYTGCVGDDELATQLREANKKENVESAYLVKAGEKTGACAVIITGHHRSLVTTLRSAEMFEPSHLSEPTVAKYIEEAKYYYIGGFFLTHGVESTVEIAKSAAKSSKTVAINLSAPFIPQFFKVQLEQVLPYCDIIIGNDSEALAWAEAAGLPEKDHKSIALALSQLPKSNPSRPRTVVITGGASSTLLATSTSTEVKVFPVTPLKGDEIVDTNGAGDMFAGGFMGALISGKSVEESILVGHKLGAMCVGTIGPQLKWPKEKVL